MRLWFSGLPRFEYPRPVQLEFRAVPPTHAPSPSPAMLLAVGGRLVPLVFVRNQRARRYILRLTRAGAARVTVPRGGTMAYAREFALRHVPWLEQQLARTSAREAQLGRPCTTGSELLFRGELVAVLAGAEPGVFSFADQSIRVADPGADLRPYVRRHLHRLAGAELPPRVFELAAVHGLTVKRVTVRNQRSRWGSCSSRGSVSLNWRLIQAPSFVRDYIILHELMHLREMNHSARFWRHVERACPAYLQAEAWLKKHNDLLRA